MPPYFILECIAPEDWSDPALVEGIAPPTGEASWRIGKKFLNPPTEPIVISLHEDYGTQMKELRNVDALLMTQRLYDAFKFAGINNLDAYKTIVRHKRLSFESKNYLACNLIGIVKALNKEKSQILNQNGDASPMDTDVESVVLVDNFKTDLLMFRLFENTSAIVIHDSVKRSLEQQGFDMLTFVPLNEWIG